MSSSGSSTTLDDQGPTTKKETVKTLMPEKENCSDSDFVDYKKNSKLTTNPILVTAKARHVLHQSTPVQKSDITSLKLNFQQKLMGSNDKLAKLMQNKQNIADRSVSASPSPIKGILKIPNKSHLNSTDTNGTKEKSKNNMVFAFSPMASSTQVEDQAKIKKKRKTINDSEDSKSPDVHKHKKRRQEGFINHRESSNSDDVGKKSKKKQLKETVYHTASSSSSGEDEKKQKNQQKESLSPSDINESEKVIKIKRQSQNEPSSSSENSFSDVDKQRVAKHGDVKVKKKSVTKHQSRKQSDVSSTSSDSEDEQKVNKKSNLQVEQHRNKIKKVHKRDTNSSSPSSSEELSSTKNNLRGHKRKLHSPKKKKSISVSDSSSLSEDDRSTRTSSKKLKPAQIKQNQSLSDSDSDVEVEKSHKSLNSKDFGKSATLLKKFEADHKLLSKVKAQHDSLKDIKSNQAIFLVQIPKRLDPQQLLGTKISLTGQTRVPTKSRKYDCITSRKPQDPVAIFAGTRDLQLVKPAGNIKVQRHIKLKHLPDLAGPWSAGVSFPDNLKERHPLFGADYVGKICLEEHIQEKLNAAVQSYAKRKMKKKKHKNKDGENISAPKEEEIFKFLSQTDAIKEKKKSKQKDSVNNIFNEIESGSKKKKLNSEDRLELTVKKRTHKNQENELIEQYVSSVTVKHGKKKKFENDGICSPEKHCKKGKGLNDTSELINEMLLSESLNLLKSDKKKKKRNHPHGSINEDEVNVDTSDIIEEAKKKKHKKHHKTYD